MKWDKHIKYILNKTKYLIYIFAKIKKFMDTKTLMTIYYAFCHSLINYGIIDWGRAYNNNLTLLQKIETRILKFISENNCLANIPLNVNQLFTLEALVYHYEDLSEIYKTSKSKTRKKYIQLPKTKKAISIITVAT